MKASEYVIKNYPNVKIVGRYHGYFSKEEDTQITENIRISNHDILIVALGSALADASAAIYSIIETAKANDLNPYEYLKFILKIF